MKKLYFFAVILLSQASIASLSAQTQVSYAQQLVPTVIESGQFGWSSAMTADQLFVGQYRATSVIDGTSYANSGKVLIYDKGASGWVLSDSILSPVAEIGSSFGYSVATDGKRLIVGGAESFRTSGSKDGFVMIYAKNDAGKWIAESDVLRLPTEGIGGQFGAYSAINGDIAASGAYLATIGGKASVGTAGIIERGADGKWAVTQIDSPTPTASSFFGRAFAITGGNVIIGSGKVGVFSYTKVNGAWTLKQTIDVVNNANQMALAVEGSNLLVNNYSNAKTFYYTLGADGQWSQQQTIEQENLGNAVAISGNNAVITSKGGGNAYLYGLADGQWSAKAVLLPGSATATFGNVMSYNGTDAAVSVATQALANAAGANVVNVGTVFCYDLSNFTTGIAPITTAGKVQLVALQGAIAVSAAEATPVSIYRVDGRLAAQLTAAAGETRISLPQGIYLVKAGAKSAKVAVR
jgi:hypothetical protein